VNDQTFKAERVSKSASITLNGPIEKVFPSLVAVEEKKWADGWDPVVLYPESGHLEEGMTFITRAQWSRRDDIRVDCFTVSTGMSSYRVRRVDTESDLGDRYSVRSLICQSDDRHDQIIPTQD